MRSNRFVVVSNCILNQNAVLIDWERAPGAYPFSNLIINKGIGIVTLPCPETLAKGVNRPPMNYDDYNTITHRNLCNDLCEIPIRMIQELVKGGSEFIGTIGIHNSPNCSITDQRGVFMEEFFKKLEENNLNTNYLEVPTDYVYGNNEKEKDFEKELEKFFKIKNFYVYYKKRKVIAFRFRT